jgi:hypothetical protein
MESTKSVHPTSCLCGLCVAQRLYGGSPRDRSEVARQIVGAAAIEELRRLSADSRGRLRDALSLGVSPPEERVALRKLLKAELLEKIPEPALLTVEFQQGVVVTGAQDFVERARSDLDRIAQVEMGGLLLRSLASRGSTVTIVSSSRTNDARPDNYRAAFAPGKSFEWRDETGKDQSVMGSGCGSGTTIRYNPALSTIGFKEDWQRQPPAVWLAHELIHADDAAHGRMDPELKDGVRNYERQAVGLPPYEKKEFTENRFRAEWSEPLPQRPRY